MLLGLLFSYLLGSIPFGFLWSSILHKQDIRTIGSENIGATNAFRVGGRYLALLTFFGDFFKGLIPVYLGMKLYSVNVGALWGMAAIIGHMFPIWLKGKGGKGISTRMGVYGALNTLFGLILLTTWTAVFLNTRYSSLASLTTIALSIFLAWIFFPLKIIVLIYLIEIFILIKHRSNIDNLMKGTEKKIL